MENCVKQIADLCDKKGRKACAFSNHQGRSGISIIPGSQGAC